ncbi:endoplasmic reticulum junction formation protein lunapark-like [Antedon mediterranea]|uniref:endoplasmic reticulum junction formation protein lunapark-like n=1 Tax=Antedon mediterranea TaxID=105859 RepID=UPI003AF52B10
MKVSSMGSLLTRFRKKKTTVEILEDIENDISRLLKYKRQDQQLEKQYLGSLIIYSIIVYIVGALVFYLSFWPQTYTDTIIRVIPLLVFPFVIWGIRKLLQWYFVKRKIKNDIALEDLREKKKKILEDVKETESYKKAKEILERFDPSSRPPPPTVVPVGPSQPATALRQRTKAPLVMGRPMARPQQSSMPQKPMAAIGPTTPQQFVPRRPITPRPILPQQRGKVDKLMDFLVGDGPENRYALICKQCHSHNGMALKEEFEYLSFRCAYCNFLNEARKQRKNAPKLPEVSLLNSPAFSIQAAEERVLGSQEEEVEEIGNDEQSENILEKCLNEGATNETTIAKEINMLDEPKPEIKTDDEIMDNILSDTKSALSVKDDNLQTVGD